LVLNECFAQTDSLPISINIKVDKQYVRTYSKNADAFATAIQQKLYVVSSDSIKEKYFDITLEIKNTSIRPIGIWLMTCSWEDNFQVNNNYIFMKGHECDSNFPTYVKFNPGESKIYTTTLIKSIKFDYPCQYCIYGPQVKTTKLGLVFIDDIFKRSLNILDYFVIMQDKSERKIVWSNPLYLLTTDESSPKPIEIPVYRK
jgi:hypothetical protein